MSYPNWTPAPVPAEPAVPVRRPAVVTAAAGLLVVLAAGGLLASVVVLLSLNGTVDRFRAAAAGTAADPDQVDGMVLLLRGLATAATLLSVAAAVLLVVLALGLLRGGAGSRAATWGVCGLGLLCGCGALTLSGVQRAVPLRLGTDSAVTADLVAAATGAYPSWWLPLNAGLSVAQALGYLVVALLLGSPPANGYFRRRPPGQQPAPTAVPQQPSTTEPSYPERTTPPQ
ncbi:hypothetical protein [Micromonospora echinofusca]|uniref:hypothetical protein n=1 Tax=Micromonospora echinofusca TaxID=47858 RepID=UPI001FCAB57B|nr:hypothetical protein [Micromonospora echinofusca]